MASREGLRWLIRRACSPRCDVPAPDSGARATAPLRRSTTPADPPGRTGAGSLVYVFQPSLQHYRLPIWDLLVESGRDRYDLVAFGQMSGGEAFGGGTRAYLRPMPQVRVPIPALTLLRWPHAARLVERDRPDVVIVAANPRNLTCWRLRRVCRRLGITSIAHAKVDSFAGLPDWAVDRFKRRFFAGFDELVCYGEHARAKALALGLPDEHISVARNTIDTRRIFLDDGELRRRATELRQALGSSRILVSVGRLEPDKRAEDLLAAWPALRARHPDLHLVLVGGGPGLDATRTQAAEVDPEHIVVTGRVPDGDDYAWIAAADVCVFPGAVGLAVNQSLALGVATVIADEQSSDAELVVDGVTGWRYPRGDVAALVETVDRVLAPAGAGEVADVGERSRALMRDEVTVEKMVEVFDAAISRNLDGATVGRMHR